MAYSLDLRKRAIALLEAGKNTGEVGEFFGVHDQTVSGWKKRYDGGSWLQNIRPRAGHIILMMKL